MNDFDFSRLYNPSRTLRHSIEWRYEKNYNEDDIIGDASAKSDLWKAYVSKNYVRDGGNLYERDWTHRRPIPSMRPDYADECVRRCRAIIASTWTTVPQKGEWCRAFVKAYKGSFNDIEQINLAWWQANEDWKLRVKKVRAGNWISDIKY